MGCGPARMRVFSFSSVTPYLNGGKEGNAPRRRSGRTKTPPVSLKAGDFLHRSLTYIQDQEDETNEITFVYLDVVLIGPMARLAAERACAACGDAGLGSCMLERQVVSELDTEEPPAVFPGMVQLPVVHVCGPKGDEGDAVSPEPTIEPLSPPPRLTSRVSNTSFELRSCDTTVEHRSDQQSERSWSPEASQDGLGEAGLRGTRSPDSTCGSDAPVAPPTPEGTPLVMEAVDAPSPVPSSTPSSTLQDPRAKGRGSLEAPPMGHVNSGDSRKNSRKSDSTVMERDDEHTLRCYYETGDVTARVHFWPIQRFSDSLPSFPRSQLQTTAYVGLVPIDSEDLEDSCLDVEQRLDEARCRAKGAAVNVGSEKPQARMACMAVTGSKSAQLDRAANERAYEAWLRRLELEDLVPGRPVDLESRDALFQALVREITEWLLTERGAGSFVASRTDCRW